MNILDRFSTTIKVCVLFAFVAIIACVTGYIYSTMPARAAGEQNCSIGGVTAYWTGGEYDVTCYDDNGDFYIENFDAADVELTGNATDKVRFLSGINGFYGLTNLRLNSLTGTDCLNSYECLFIRIEDTNSTTINVLSNSQIGGLQLDNIEELNITGNGLLTLNNGIYYEHIDKGVLNIYSNVVFKGGGEGTELAIAVQGDLNILGGNIDINIDTTSVLGFGVIFAGHVKITNESNITATIKNSGIDEDMFLLSVTEGLTLGDKIVAKRDGIAIDPLEYFDVLIAAGDKAVFTFGASATGPTDPNNPTTDLTPPNTGYKRS